MKLKGQKMSDLWGEFFSNGTVKKIQEKYGQELAEAAIHQELQMHLDELTFEQIEKHVKQIKESIEDEERAEDE